MVMKAIYEFGFLTSELMYLLPFHVTSIQWGPIEEPVEDTLLQNENTMNTHPTCAEVSGILCSVPWGVLQKLKTCKEVQLFLF